MLVRRACPLTRAALTMRRPFTGRIHISQPAHSLLIASGMSHSHEWEATGGVEVKGKGIMDTYLWKETSTPGVRSPQVSVRLDHCTWPTLQLQTALPDSPATSRSMPQFSPSVRPLDPDVRADVKAWHSQAPPATSEAQYAPLAACTRNVPVPSLPSPPPHVPRQPAGAAAGRAQHPHAARRRRSFECKAVQRMLPAPVMSARLSCLGSPRLPTQAEHAAGATSTLAPPFAQVAQLLTAGSVAATAPASQALTRLIDLISKPSCSPGSPGIAGDTGLVFEDDTMDNSHYLVRLSRVSASVGCNIRQT